MPFYALALSAERQGIISIRAACGVAISAADAERQGIAHLRAEKPPRGGWHNHRAGVMEVPADDIARAYAELMEI